MRAHLIPTLLAARRRVTVVGWGMAEEIYNMGSGVGWINQEIVAAMSSLMQEIGCTIRVDYQLERIFDVQANVLDSSMLRQHTGWAPQLNFEAGLLRTRDWLSGFLG